MISMVSSSTKNSYLEIIIYFLSAMLFYKSIKLSNNLNFFYSTINLSFIYCNNYKSELINFLNIFKI